MQSTVITRKVQINFDVKKEKLKECYDTWFNYSRICHKAANMIASHQYLQDQVKDLFYFSDETKVKLANAEKDDLGILSMSRSNTTYALLSKHFKGEAPMGMLSGLNQVVSASYKKESKDIWKGNKSLRSYRYGMPMPMRFADSSNWKKGEDGNYAFSVYGTDFKTYFGRDMSGNEQIFDRAIKNEYKFCDSSIQLKKEGGKWRMYLLAVFRIPQQVVELDSDKEAICLLDPEYPIKIQQKKDKFFYIGNKDEYWHRRIAIRGAMQRLQKSLKYTNGGDGRKLKMQALDRYKKAEENYVNNKMHQYSRHLINYCLKNKIGKIVLKDYEEKMEQSKEVIPNTGLSKNEPLLRSWSFSNLAGKIVYKAASYGIEVILKDIKVGKEEEIKEAEIA